MAKKYVFLNNYQKKTKKKCGASHRHVFTIYEIPTKFFTSEEFFTNLASRGINSNKFCSCGLSLSPLVSVCFGSPSNVVLGRFCIWAQGQNFGGYIFWGGLYMWGPYLCI